MSQVSICMLGSIEVSPNSRHKLCQVEVDRESDLCILGPIVLNASSNFKPSLGFVFLLQRVTPACVCHNPPGSTQHLGIPLPKRTCLRTRARPPVLVKGLGKPTVQIMLRGPEADVHLLFGRWISTLRVGQHERFSTLRERARATLTDIFTRPETAHAQFSSNGWKLQNNFLRRKVRKAQLK